MEKTCENCAHLWDSDRVCLDRSCDIVDPEAINFAGWEPKEPDKGQPEDAPTSTRRRVLEQAIQCVCTDRNTQYGSPEDSFKVIAQLWEPYIRDRCVPHGADVSIGAGDVGVLMALMKIGRIATGSYKEDSYIDAAGYIACAAQCETKGG